MSIIKLQLITLFKRESLTDVKQMRFFEYFKH